MIIDGKRVGVGQREYLPLLDPSTGDIIDAVPVASTEDLDAALAAGSSGLKVWARTPPSARADVLLTASQLLRERSADIAATLTFEQGKVLSESKAEVTVSADLLTWFAGEAARIHDRVSQGPTEGMELCVKREPVGVTAILTPWNFPLIEPAAHAAAALAAGCPVIFKVSEETPLTGIALVEALLDAGLPPSVAQLVTGHPAIIADHLIASPVVRKVAFTGSVGVGKALAAKAAAHMKPSTMELGGNAAALVLEDAPVGEVVSQLVASKSRNAGQVCTAPNRIYVHRSIFDEFVDAFVSAAGAVRIGPGGESSSEMGPLANPRRLEAMRGFMEDARRRGADVATGGRRMDGPGFFYENTVVVDPPDDAQVATQEIFGPVTPIFAFDDVGGAVRRANDTDAGLAGYVFGEDLERARSVAAAIQAGTVAINHTRAMFTEAPFGGIKDSGFGRIGGPEGMDGYLVTRLVSTRRTGPACNERLERSSS
jgi:succinate-semialdehyde dehydrogenase/glutarate-semialdehyde dehydrogenase